MSVQLGIVKSLTRTEPIMLNTPDASPRDLKSAEIVAKALMQGLKAKYMNEAVKKQALALVEVIEDMPMCLEMEAEGEEGDAPRKRMMRAAQIVDHLHDALALEAELY